MIPVLLKLLKEATAMPSGLIAAIIVGCIIGVISQRIFNYFIQEKTARKKVNEWQEKQNIQNNKLSEFIGHNAEQIEEYAKTTGEHLNTLTRTVELHIKDKTIHEQANEDVDEIKEDITKFKDAVIYEDTFKATKEGFDKRITNLEHIRNRSTGQ